MSKDDSRLLENAKWWNCSDDTAFDLGQSLAMDAVDTALEAIKYTPKSWQRSLALWAIKWLKRNVEGWVK